MTTKLIITVISSVPHSLLSHTPEQRPTAIAADCYYHLLQAIASFGMEREAAQTARESLDLAFHMSNILDTGLDRHTLSVLIALCDLGFNPEALSAVVRELRTETTSSPLIPTTSPPLP